MIPLPLPGYCHASRPRLQPPFFPVEVPATPGWGTVVGIPHPNSSWVYLLHEHKLFSRPLCHSASRHSQDVGTEPYFIFYICKSHFILYLYRAKKTTYLFSDLQYVSYLTPLYFVDFTNKASSFFFFSTNTESVWSFLNLGQSCVGVRPDFLAPSSFAARHAQECTQKRWDGG